MLPDGGATGPSYVRCVRPDYGEARGEPMSEINNYSLTMLLAYSDGKLALLGSKYPARRRASHDDKANIVFQVLTMGCD